MCKNEIESEEFSKSIFSSYLKTVIPDANIKWEKYPNGKCNSPDFFMYLEGNKYTVEVTRIDFNVKKNLLVKKFEETWNNIIKQVNQEAKKSGIIYGLYVIKPSPQTKFRNREKEDVKNQILHFVKETKESCESQSKVLQHEGKIYGKIWKEKTPSLSSIELSFTYGSWLNSPEFKEKIYSKLKKAINKKIKNLKEIEKPWILLLHNINLLATYDIYKNYKEHLKELDMFHSVFLISEWSENGFFLHTTDKNWLKKQI